MHEITIYTKNASKEIIGNAVAYDKQDKKILKDIYKKWVELNEQIGLLKGRRILLPGELIEGIVCLQCGMWKVTNGISRRYDLWDPNSTDGKNRICVQATTSAIFQMFLPDYVIGEVDRILFVKFYFSTNETLKYEILDFDIEQVLQIGNSNYPTRRTVIKYSDLKEISYNNIIIGEL
ncbi:MAG: Bsp6I family type II restriction endonuclease [Lachnospiraceae bacterium]|nr:Bsp6I family type II restriction endonuclease [Lachnospiraceae bacterium]